MTKFFKFTSSVKIIYLGGYIALVMFTLPVYIVSRIIIYTYIIHFYITFYLYIIGMNDINKI